MAFKKVTERFVQWVWQNCGGMINQTLTREKIEVLSPGVLNREDGPDFRHSLIKFNGEVSKGDVEVHLFSSDWFRHKHESDARYNRVILHVVWHQDYRNAITRGKRTIPTVVLSEWGGLTPGLLRHYQKEIKGKYKCPYTKNSLIDVLKTQGLNRFNHRKQRFAELSKLYGRDQTAYLGVMESLGYVKNELAFVRLAKLIPIEKIIGLTLGKPRNEQIKSIKVSLLGVADLLPWKFQSEWQKIKHEFEETMHREEWQFFKVRPFAFPNRRIEGISYFLAEVAQQGIWDFFVTHDLDGIEKKIAQGRPPIGRVCAKITILNVCLPILAAGGNILEKEVVQIYQNYKKLPENYITKLMSKVLKWDKKKWDEEVYYQGMIHIFQNYCHIKQCYACPIKMS